MFNRSCYISICMFLLLLSSIDLNAQQPDLSEEVEQEFRETNVPDKWKNESAVILGQKIQYTFARPSNPRLFSTCLIYEYVHKRIKLQDKNALEQFSTFFYVTIGRNSSASYTVVKSSGKAVEIDMKNAIEDDSEIPDIYKPIFLSANIKFYKIAIPDLEIGDIVDYKYDSRIDWDMRKNGIEFTPFIFTLNRNYPVLFQKYQFRLSDGMMVQFRGFNNAPNLRYDPKSSNIKDYGSISAYTLVDKDREKSSEERWHFPYRNLPTIKFKVFMLADTEGNGMKTLGSATVDRSRVDINRLYAMYTSIAAYKNPVVDAMVNDVNNYLKTALKKEESPKIIVRETYYALRKVFLESYYKGEIKAETSSWLGGKRTYKRKDSAKEMADKDDEIRMNKIYFASAMYKLLAKRGVPVEVVAYIPRTLGGWNELLFEEELDIAMKVRGDKYAFLLPCNNFDAFAVQQEALDGADAYAFSLVERDSYYRSNIPASTAKENLEQQVFNITVPENMEALNVERTSVLTGIAKSDVIQLANLDRDYLNRDFTKYAATSGRGGATTYTDNEKEERRKTQLEYLKKRVERDELEVSAYNNFELLKDGRYDESQDLSFKENFTVKKLVNKAGRNYLFEVGKLIGGQIKLGPEELKQRQNNIWIANARTISNQITVQLPAGYTAEGLQDLQFNVDNASGSFISTAKLQDGKLIITTDKVYKKNFDTKDAWPNYVAFLEAGYKFTQAKVVLKKL